MRTGILWGTDSVWYGPPQPLIDAFPAFTIPDRLQEAHGHPKLTPRAKQRILGGNASALYRIEPTLASGTEQGWVPEVQALLRARLS